MGFMFFNYCKPLHSANKPNLTLSWLEFTMYNSCSFLKKQNKKHVNVPIKHIWVTLQQ